jgi:hypothetical protein
MNISDKRILFIEGNASLTLKRKTEEKNHLIIDVYRPDIVWYLNFFISIPLHSKSTKLNSHLKTLVRSFEKFLLRSRDCINLQLLNTSRFRINVFL